MSIGESNDKKSPVKAFEKLLPSKENDLKVLNLLCTLSTLSTWPSVLFEIIVEYYQTMNTCYIFGGIGGLGTGDTHHDCGRLTNGVWNEMTPRPRPRTAHASSRIGEYIYVTGGCAILIDGTASVAVDRIHIPTSTWSIVKSLPHPKKDHGCVTVDDTLYCIGGHDGKDMHHSMFQYDSKNEKWISRPPMKKARQVASYIHFNKCIYAFGGYNDEISCEVYDIDNMQWNDISPMLDNRWGGVAVVVEDKIILIGGTLVDGIVDIEVDHVDQYCPMSNRWCRLNWTLPCRLGGISWYDSVNKLLYYVVRRYTTSGNSVVNGVIYARRMTNDETNEWIIMGTHQVDFGFECSSVVVTY
jgi:hypothetical protein